MPSMSTYTLAIVYGEVLVGDALMPPEDFLDKSPFGIFGNLPSGSWMPLVLSVESCNLALIVCLQFHDGTFYRCTFSVLSGRLSRSHFQHL